MFGFLVCRGTRPLNFVPIFVTLNSAVIVIANQVDETDTAATKRRDPPGRSAKGRSFSCVPSMIDGAEVEVL